MESKQKILIISPGVEDSGIRGLGKVTISLIDGLAAAGYEPYLLTGAPVRMSARPNETAKFAALRRSIDHYLVEGLRSPALTLKRSDLMGIIIRDFLNLFIARRAMLISSRRPVPTQHQPAVLQHFTNVSGYANFALFYKLASRLPNRFGSLVIFAMARRCGIGTIMTSSPYPLKKPLFFLIDI